MTRGFRSAGRVLAFGVAIVWSLGAQAAERVALVIANSAYAKQTTLANPPLDAQGVAAALQAIGFEVQILPNLGKAQMGIGLRDFSRRAAQAEVAVLYYAGHGLEVAKANYLIPVDAELLHERDVVYEGVPLEEAIGAVAPARGLRLVILDACRDNPFAQSMARIDPTRNLTRGLERIEPSGGVHVAYAAKAGSLAQDGQAGRYSPFAAALIETLREPPRGVDRLFGAVRERVLAATGGRQEPHLYGPPFSGDVYLTPPGATAPAQTPASSAQPAQFAAPAPQPTAPPPATATAMATPASQPSFSAPAPALDPAQQALCDAASHPKDRDRPTGVAGIVWAHLQPERHIAACEAMTRAAPGERRFFATLSRLYQRMERNTEAMAMAQRGADLGSAAAMKVMGSLLEDGKGGVPKDNSQAFLWRQRAVAAGDPDAMVDLGGMYEDGVGVVKNYGEALRLYRQAASMGDSRGAMGVGWMYESGRGVPKDEKEALRWYRTAAEAGSARAISNLGNFHEGGRGGLPQNHAEAVRLYQQAADLGDALAMVNLGWMHEDGRGGLQKNNVEAVRWYRAGAQAGNGRAMGNLGVMYEYGRGVPQSDAEAVRWYREGAEAGNARSMNNLGRMYARGGGLPQSDAEAVRWYLQSAEKDYAWGMNNLGWMYGQGRGVPRDAAQARRWLQKAVDSDDEEASAAARENLAKLTP